MACNDCKDDCRQGRDCPNAVTYDLWPGVIKWFIGMGLLVFFPLIIIVGTAICLVYYIPMAIGGWVYDFILKVAKNEESN